jgi:GT2 family glycosyltransferase
LQELNDKAHADTGYPKISVVMSVHNGSKYLKDAVESILNQTFQDFEFIIVNDASTDDTEEILKQFDDSRIKIIKNPENLGLTKSLNIGIKAAKGEYIARMDADDISLPHRFEIQVNFLENNPDYALVGSKFYNIDESGNTKSLIDVPLDNLSIHETLKKNNCFAHGSIIMKKDAFLTVGGYNEQFKFAQDYDLWLRLAEAYKVANIEEPLYQCRYSEDTISAQNFTEQFYYATFAKSQAEKRESQNKVTLKPFDILKEKNCITDEELDQNWKRTAEEMGMTIKELQAYIEELGKGKAWLEEQREKWKKLAEEHHAWIDELQKGKDWIEEEWKKWKKLAEDRQVHINEIEKKYNERR